MVALLRACADGTIPAQAYRVIAPREGTEAAANAGDVEVRVAAGDVGEARREAGEGDDMGCRLVAAHDVGDGQAGQLGDVGEVGTVVGHGEDHLGSVRGRPGVGDVDPGHGSRQVGTGRRLVEGEEQGAGRGHEVDDPGGA